MKAIKGYHSEWNIGSLGGWVFQGSAQRLGKMAWEMVSDSLEGRSFPTARENIYGPG